MADGERRMLFDTRGKRKHVIRVVYAILALLMGASLFLVVGPFNLAELTGGSSGGNASEVFEEQAERIEGRLAKDSQDEQLLLALTRARINAANSMIEPGEGEASIVSLEAREELAAASEAWSRYLKQAGNEPSAAAAQLVAATYLQLAESGSTSYTEANSNIEQAAKAQQIAADQKPSIGTLSTLAIYAYFSGDVAGGDKAKKQAASKAPTKAEGTSIENQLDASRKRAEDFQKKVKQESKLQQSANKEAPQNPFGLGGTTPGG